MRRLRLLLGLASLTMATPTLAGVNPAPPADDARIGVLRYSPIERASLQAPVGRDLTLLMPAGEHVQSAVLSDPDAWHVDVSTAADAISVRASRPGATTLLSVRTDMHNYYFTLSSAVGASSPSLVRIDNGVQARLTPPPTVSPPPVAPESGAYKLSGDKALLPSSIRDDGAKMYIDWSASQAIPAVFAIDELGHEETINGYMRGGSFTIDRIYDQLLFRIDNAEATARRVAPKRK